MTYSIAEAESGAYIHVTVTLAHRVRRSNLVSYDLEFTQRDGEVTVMGRGWAGGYLNNQRIALHKHDVPALITALQMVIAGPLGRQALMQEHCEELNKAIATTTVVGE